MTDPVVPPGCDQTMPSMGEPEHVHTCAGHDTMDDPYHYCPACRRWWWKKEKT